VIFEKDSRLDIMKQMPEIWYYLTKATRHKCNLSPYFKKFKMVVCRFGRLMIDLVIYENA